jgi:hypothetical protein
MYLCVYLSILSIYLSVCLSIYLFVHPSIHPSIHPSSCCSQLEHRASVKHFVSLQFLNLRQSVGSLGRGSACRKAATYTGQHKHPQEDSWYLFLLEVKSSTPGP